MHLNAPSVCAAKCNLISFIFYKNRSYDSFMSKTTAVCGCNEVMMWLPLNSHQGKKWVSRLDGCWDFWATDQKLVLDVCHRAARGWQRTSILCTSVIGGGVCQSQPTRRLDWSLGSELRDTAARNHVTRSCVGRSLVTQLWKNNVQYDSPFQTSSFNVSDFFFPRACTPLFRQRQ